MSGVELFLAEEGLVGSRVFAAVLTVAFMVVAMGGVRPKLKERRAAALLAAGFFAIVAAMLAIPVTMDRAIAALITAAIAALHVALTLNTALSLVTPYGSIWSNLPSEVVTAAVVSAFVIADCILVVAALYLAMALPEFVGRYVTLLARAEPLCADQRFYLRCTACTDVSTAKKGTSVDCAALLAVSAAFLAAGVLAAVVLAVLLARMAWWVMLQERRWRMLVQHQMAAAPTPVLPLAVAEQLQHENPNTQNPDPEPRNPNPVQGVGGRDAEDMREVLEQV